MAINTRTLSETRKADRQRMAELVIQLARRLGAKADYHDVFKDRPNEVWVVIEAPGGLQLTVDFDGKSWQPNTYVLSWHMSHTSDKKLCPIYWDRVNNVHYLKATDVAVGFDELANLLATRLAAAKSGAAYQQ